MRSSGWVDRIGWFIEKGIIWLFCSLFVVLLLGNKVLLLFNSNYSSLSLEMWLYQAYDKIVEPNIGTITTIATF